VRNPGGPTGVAVGLRERVRNGELVGPAILTAGDILNRAPRFDGLTRPVATDADIAREVSAQAAAKVDFVKVYGNLTPNLVGAAIRAAHNRGLKVIGHLQATSWTEAARMGIDAIAHGASWAVDELPPTRCDVYHQAMAERGAMRARLQWLDDVQPDGAEIQEMIEELAKRRISVDPTLIAYATKFTGNEARFVESPDLRLAPERMRTSFPSNSFVQDWSAEDFAHGRRVWPKMLALVRAYHRGGVLLTAGSDEPNSWIVPGPSLHTELELLVEAGLSPLEALTIATRNGAESLDLSAVVGTVTVGKRADLVVVDHDPTQNIRNTRAISLVVQGGRRNAPAELQNTFPFRRRLEAARVGAGRSPRPASTNFSRTASIRLHRPPNGLTRARLAETVAEANRSGHLPQHQRRRWRGCFAIERGEPTRRRGGEGNADVANDSHEPDIERRSVDSAGDEVTACRCTGPAEPQLQAAHVGYRSRHPVPSL
jgi:Amidohydrolase family